MMNKSTEKIVGQNGQNEVRAKEINYYTSSKNYSLQSKKLMNLMMISEASCEWRIED